jgi:ribulose 1,5-bisphosphate synthetase/thiazole synthase
MEQSSEHQEIEKMEKETHFDVLIIGAGISGIDAAYHIQKHCDWVRDKVSLLGVDSLWGDCTFIPADWGS